MHLRTQAPSLANANSLHVEFKKIKKAHDANVITVIGRINPRDKELLERLRKRVGADNLATERPWAALTASGNSTENDPKNARINCRF
jgi:hypothetical protein